LLSGNLVGHALKIVTLVWAHKLAIGEHYRIRTTLTNVLSFRITHCVIMRGRLGKSRTLQPITWHRMFAGCAGLAVALTLGFGILVDWTGFERAGIERR
jgi:hypothetical protein